MKRMKKMFVDSIEIKIDTNKKSKFKNLFANENDDGETLEEIKLDVDVDKHAHARDSTLHEIYETSKKARARDSTLHEINTSNTQKIEIMTGKNSPTLNFTIDTPMHVDKTNIDENKTGEKNIYNEFIEN